MSTVSVVLVSLVCVRVSSICEHSTTPPPASDWYLKSLPEQEMLMQGPNIPQIRFLYWDDFRYLYLAPRLTRDALAEEIGRLSPLSSPQWCTSQPDPHLLLTAPVFHAHPSPSSEHPPPPLVETGLVWLPTVEMMDWWLTYGKGQGPSSKQVQSCIKYEGGKGKHALPFGGGRLDRYAVYSAHVKSPALKCYLLKTACLCVSLRPILI